MKPLLLAITSNSTNKPRVRGRLPQIGRLLGVLAGAFVLVSVLTNAAGAQDPESMGQYQAPKLLAPPFGGIISKPESLRFRWQVPEEYNVGETDSFTRFYQRLTVKQKPKEVEAETSLEDSRFPVVYTFPVPRSIDQSQGEPSETGPYPTVGGWFPEVEERTSSPDDEVLEVRLSHPTVGGWFPGGPVQTPLPDGTYLWEVSLVGVTPEGMEQVLASSQVSTFTASFEGKNARKEPAGEESAEEEPPTPAKRTVQLDLFDLRLTGPAAEAALILESSTEGEPPFWRIEIQSPNFPITLRWDPAAVTDSLPDGPVRLVDAETGGELVEVDMKENGATEITNPNVRALEVRPGQDISTQMPDQVVLTVVPKAGLLLSGVSSFGDISGEASSSLSGEQSVFTWSGSLAFGSRDGPANFRLTGLRTTGSLASTTEGIESTSVVPERMLALTGDLVLRPFPRLLIQPYAIGGAGARRLTVSRLTEVGTDTRWNMAAQVGMGADLRLGNLTLGVEVIDYLTGFTETSSSNGGLQHDAFLFLTLGIPIF